MNTTPTHTDASASPAASAASVPPRRPAGLADLLTMGFATTVGMWAMGYVLRMPVTLISPMIVAVGLGLVMLAGGFFTGLLTERGWRGGLGAGLITGVLNLLILGGVLDSMRHDNSALTWIPGTLIATMAIMTLGSAIGAAMHRPRNPLSAPANWTGRFALVAVAATGLLIIAGGLVTGHEAGLAVPDWPDSYGYNMLLFPFARMTGSIYYEHAHRLYGMLVGFTTIVLAIHIYMTDRRRWMKVLITIAIAAVIAQGVMGALRVVLAHSHGGVQVATEANETESSSILRIAHGVFGQIFLGLMVSVAAFCSTTWKSHVERLRHANAKTDRVITLLLVCGLVLQLILGAFVRHWGVGVFEHISLASILFVLTVVIGVRLWGLYGEQSVVLRRLGISLIIFVTIQVGLGIAALVMINLTKQAGKPLNSEAIVTTMHQANGAILLSLAITAMLMTRRLLTPAPTGETADAGEHTKMTSKLAANKV